MSIRLRARVSDCSNQLFVLCCQCDGCVGARRSDSGCQYCMHSNDGTIVERCIRSKTLLNTIHKRRTIITQDSNVSRKSNRDARTATPLRVAKYLSRIRIATRASNGGLYALHVSGSGVGRSRVHNNLGRLLPSTPAPTPYNLGCPALATMSIFRRLLLFFEAGFIQAPLYRPK